MHARAQVWEGGQKFSLVDIPLPEPGPGEVLVRVTTATICGSDRHTVSGRRQAACPSVLGHEGVGIVVDSRRDGIQPGERVVFAVTASCGACRNCAHGLSAKCAHVLKVGHESFNGEWPLSGTYATHILLRAGQAIERVPDSLSDAIASTAGCAVATVMAVLDRAGDLRGRTVLITGAGMLGTIALAAARDRGAERIIASDYRLGERHYLRNLADDLVTPGTPHLIDVALEFSGAASAAEECVNSLDIGGTAVLAGTVTPVPSIALDPEWLVRGWRTVTGVHNYEPRHLAEAVAFLGAEGESLPWDHILGAPITLEELPSAFADGPAAPRVVVKM